MKRVFLIVLDSAGIGEMPDAAAFGDAGSNTLASVAKSPYFHVPHLRELGYFNIDGVNVGEKAKSPIGAYGRLAESSPGKDTTIGHWEIAGHISSQPMPTFPEGFPPEVIAEFSEKTGRGVLCNLPYSGTDVIRDYGKQHMESGDLIVYTSADSVFQIAAHEEIVPVEELYRYCEIARKMLTGPVAVGRVIARPFVGEPGNFTRTSRRHDFSLEPTGITMLDQIKDAGLTSYGIGKINDIFAGRGLTDFVRTDGNADGIEKTIAYMDEDFCGLCFVNLVDFDMLYGHRNDIDGYAKALSAFDEALPRIMAKLREEDLLMITADHGCDPGTASTDHSREYVPLLAYGSKVPAGKNLGTRPTFADIAATVLSYLGVPSECDGEALF